MKTNSNLKILIGSNDKLVKTLEEKKENEQKYIIVTNHGLSCE